jgi:acyl-CoA synthetase (AMP-forming)/AMP-acid ligase II
VEAIEPDGSSLYYTWADLEQGSARMANLLASLDLPEGSRIAVQVEKSVEAMMLYLATLRSGHVFLPLNTAYQSAEMEYFITNAEPAVVVCAPAVWLGVQDCLQPRRGPCLHPGNRSHGQLAGARGPPQRRAPGRARAPTIWRRFSTPAAPRGAARAPCSATAIC